MNKIQNANIENCEKMLMNIMAEHNIECTESMLHQFRIYFEFLTEYNKFVNLTSLTNAEDVYIKHFADSMLGQKFIKKGATVCDVGTGAGFPGVVLKIVRPDINLTLVDGLQKRVDFLKQLLTKLDISGVTVLHNRAEDADFKSQYLNSFDFVVSRAVAKLNTLAEYCLPFVKVGGCCVAYKSNDCQEEILQAKNCIDILGGEYKETINLNVDDNIERSFVIIEKIKKTNDKYPRGQNKPRLKPL